MKWLLSAVVLVAWALWLGGAVATLIFVQRLFHDDRAIAVSAAPQLFLTFERYQLVLATIVIAGIAVGGGRRSAFLVASLIAAAATACISATVITPRIEKLRLAGEGASAAFRTLHGVSMVMYLILVVLLLLAAVPLSRPAASRLQFDRESVDAVRSR